MLKKLKEQWFIVLIALILFGAVGYYVYEQNKDTLKGKKVDGQDVVVEFNGEDIFADELYADIDEATKNASIYMFFERMVMENAIETTADLKSEAKLQADALIQSYQESYGANYEEVLLQALRGVGYSKISELEEYFINSIKARDLLIQTIEEDKVNLFQAVIDEKQSRLVSHILVAMEDPSNPTEAEQAKMDAIDSALAEGKTFGEVAKEFSDDAGSAAQNGSVGYTDKDTKFVEEFLEAALALDEGETSEWVKTDYGMHLIYIDAATADTLLANEDIKEDIYNAIDSANPDLYYQAVWDTAVEAGVKFEDPEVEATLKKYMGLED